MQQDSNARFLLRSDVSLKEAPQDEIMIEGAEWRVLEPRLSQDGQGHHTQRWPATGGGGKAVQRRAEATQRTSPRNR